MARAIACKSSSRLVRGGIGAVVGSLAGALVGFGVAAVAITNATNKAVVLVGPGPNTGTMTMSVFALPGGALLGAGVGAYVGARKPQC